MNKPLLIFFLVFSFKTFCYDFENIERVGVKSAKGIDFNRLNNFDFNEDGVEDKVICRSDHYVKIKNGKNLKRNIYSWKGLRRKRNKGRHVRYLTSCDVVKIKGERPMVFISLYWRTSSWVSRSKQFVIFHNGRKYRKQAIKIDENTYWGAVRSVKCAKYPERVRKKGYRKGVLCFFADYAADNYNRSALVKFELSKDKKSVIGKDLSGSSDLLWQNGHRGTNIYTFTVSPGWASNQRDGGFMMDSAFLDFNGDRLIDFLTIGQHAKVRAHRMVLDRSRPEGIRFETTELTQANKYYDMTEFMKLKPLNFDDAKIGKTGCVHFGMELEKPSDRDHIRCFKNGRWVIYHYPVKFNSNYNSADFGRDEKGRIIVRTKKHFHKEGKVPKTLYFRIPK